METDEKIGLKLNRLATKREMIVYVARFIDYLIKMMPKFREIVKKQQKMMKKCQNQKVDLTII